MRILVSVFAMMAGLAACKNVTVVPLYVEETFSYDGKVYPDKREALGAAKVSHTDLIDKTRTATTRVVCVDFMGLYVDYTPDAAAVVPYRNPYPQLLAH